MPTLVHANLDDVSAMHFTAETQSGHKVLMDAGEPAGGVDSAARPKELLYVGLAGCTGMDVISILRKMRQDVKSFAVDVEGLESTEEHPKYWTRIRTIFTVEGDVDPAKLHKAIDYSRTRYCGVSASMKGAVKVEYRMVLNGEKTDLGEPQYT